jgi:hypothetical protein
MTTTILTWDRDWKNAEFPEAASIRDKKVAEMIATGKTTAPYGVLVGHLNPVKPESVVYRREWTDRASAEEFKYIMELLVSAYNLPSLSIEIVDHVV